MKVLLVSANTEQINMPTLPLGMACIAAATQLLPFFPLTGSLRAVKDRTDIFLIKSESRTPG